VAPPLDSIAELFELPLQVRGRVVVSLTADDAAGVSCQRGEVLRELLAIHGRRHARREGDEEETCEDQRPPRH
jgi:hypothetical protein